MRASWLALLFCACGAMGGGDAGMSVDAGVVEETDAGHDAGLAGSFDAGLLGPSDAGRDGGAPDAGSPDAGLCTPGSCVGRSDGRWTCDPSTRQCGSRPLCINPRTCVYGLVCEFAECVEVDVSGIRCSNFATLGQVTAWNPATVSPQGPITAWVRASARSSASCPEVDLLVNVALTEHPQLPLTFAQLPAGLLHFVAGDGGVTDVRTLPRTPSWARTTGPDQVVRMSLDFEVCVAAGTRFAGFFAQNGNPVCGLIP